jgi:long-chain acyl-CoA synthetase
MSMPLTVLHALNERAAQTPDAPALWREHAGEFRSTTWKTYATHVQSFALGLEQLGFGAGDCLCLLSANREEWLVASLAASALSGLSIGIYTSSSDDYLCYVAAHASAKIAVVENTAMLTRLARLRERLPALELAIVLDHPRAEDMLAPLPYIGFERVLALGARVDPNVYTAHIERIDPSSIATLSYTSGTTGNPKGVVLTHEALLASTHALFHTLGLTAGEVVVSYLPLSHIAEQLSSVYGAIVYGVQVYFNTQPERLLDVLKCARPTSFFGVPRVWEKLRSALEAEFEKLAWLPREVLAWARRTATEHNRLSLSGQRIGLLLSLQHRLARVLVLNKLRARLGLSRAHLLTTSAAPISRETLDFFVSLDLVLRELYGQTEVVGATSVNTPGDTRLYSQGRVMPGLQVKIAADGEVLVKGGAFCLGYYKAEAASRALIHDGWLHTGDLGQLSDDGYLYIVGRKHDTIARPNGARLAPSEIEARLRNIAPLDQAVVLWIDKQLTGVLTLDPLRAPSFARAHGWPEALAALALHPEFRAYIAQQIQQRAHTGLPSHAHLDTFAILPDGFTVDGGELTPTFKPKRDVIARRYQQLTQQRVAIDAA